MKIAYIFAYFGDGGGAEENAFLLASKAKESGEKPVFIASTISEASKERIQKAGFDLKILPMESSFNIFAVFKSAISLKKIVQTEKIDVIHVHMLREQSLAIFAKFFGGKFGLIRTFHRFDQFNWKMKPIMSMYRNYTDAFISISELMSKYLKYNGLTEKIEMINNGVTKIAAPKHDKAMGFIGRLAKEKGILEFIKSNMDILNDTKLVIAGTGPDFAEIKKVITDNKLNVELLGQVHGAEKTDFFKKISVLLLPSETEVLPTVVLEAYSCGLPVVAFRIDSLKALIKENNGILIDYKNYVQMGQKALQLMPNSNDYFSTNIKTYELNYSVDVMWRKTYRLYKSISAKH